MRGGAGHSKPMKVMSRRYGLGLSNAQGRDDKNNSAVSGISPRRFAQLRHENWSLPSLVLTSVRDGEL